MVSEEQLQEWERLANEATEGPWYLCGGKVCTLDSKGERNLCPKPTRHCAESWCFNGRFNKKNEIAFPDQAFSVAAREAVPALIAEVRSLQKMLHVVSDTSNKILDDNNRLEKEADYLAEIVASIHGCCVDGVEGDCDKKPDPFYEIPCVRCWREYARKAVC